MLTPVDDLTKFTIQSMPAQAVKDSPPVQPGLYAQIVETVKKCQEDMAHESFSQASREKAFSTLLHLLDFCPTNEITAETVLFLYKEGVIFFFGEDLPEKLKESALRYYCLACHHILINSPANGKQQIETLCLNLSVNFGISHNPLKARKWETAACRVTKILGSEVMLYYPDTFNLTEVLQSFEQLFRFAAREKPPLLIKRVGLGPQSPSLDVKNEWHEVPLMPPADYTGSITTGLCLALLDPEMEARDILHNRSFAHDEKKEVFHRMFEAFAVLESQRKSLDMHQCCMKAVQTFQIDGSWMNDAIYFAMDILIEIANQESLRNQILASKEAQSSFSKKVAADLKTDMSFFYRAVDLISNMLDLGINRSESGEGGFRILEFSLRFCFEYMQLHMFNSSIAINVMKNALGKLECPPEKGLLPKDFIEKLLMIFQSPRMPASGLIDLAISVANGLELPGNAAESLMELMLVKCDVENMVYSDHHKLLVLLTGEQLKFNRKKFFQDHSALLLCVITKKFDLDILRHPLIIEGEGGITNLNPENRYLEPHKNLIRLLRTAFEINIDEEVFMDVLHLNWIEACVNLIKEFVLLRQSLDAIPPAPAPVSKNFRCGHVDVTPFKGMLKDKKRLGFLSMKGDLLAIIHYAYSIIKKKPAMAKIAFSWIQGLAGVRIFPNNPEEWSIQLVMNTVVFKKGTTVVMIHKPKG